ncbi:hypothetical protein DYI24_16010 [Rhodopseudomonas sp. BR0C11]|uniref:hypothetical protein n=1 Tax=Rhodopseudomonas sp. BR0C11 TaxID=2269370 RepID=UPI0013DF77C3|nr:hypothetical protein [Rhodopseudomonas sp. BR0C11]NEV78546.1 hypothetical protein [Rhodopseudomonas sp. BR0C11]
MSFLVFSISLLEFDMRDDLQAAKSSVDWAVSQFPDFQARLDSWLKANVYVTIKEMPDNSPNNVVLAVEKEPFPLKFQVEAGAYINCIRSSLDILAATLALRHCPSLVDESYFPVTKSATIFASGGYKGHKLIKALPTTERTIIESLKPYQGGNELLYALHQLDIVRKHQRLLTTEIHPGRLGVISWGIGHFTPVATGWMRSGDDEAVIGILAKAAPHPKIDLTMQVSINETAYFKRRPVIRALNDFAGLANSIIALFNHP